MPTFDVALLGEIGQRSSHGDTGHPELIAERLLGRQRVTGSDSAAGNLVVQHQEELAMQRHPGTGSHPAAGLLHEYQCCHTALAVEVRGCYNYITSRQADTPFDYRTDDDRDRCSPAPRHRPGRADRPTGLVGRRPEA